MRPQLQRPGRRETGIVVATVVLASWSVAAGQRGGGVPPGPPQPATGNHAVSGRVVDADSNRPIAGASVVVERSGSFQPIPHRPTTSEADGRFTVAGLPGGSFTLVATADGYARGFSSGVALATGTTSGGQREAQVVSGVEIRMWRAGAIAGRVTNSDGAPIANATVEARQRSPRGRGSMLSVPRVTTTDRLGLYRFDDLPPSEYLVTALFTAVTMPGASWERFRRGGPTPANADNLIARVRASRLLVPTPAASRMGDLMFQMFSSEGPAPSPGSIDANGRPHVYAMTFHPASSSMRDATPVRLSAGDERTGIDFKLPARTTARVSGVVTAGGGPAPHVGLRLVAPADPAAEAFEFTFPNRFEYATTFTDEQGAFTFLGVPAGTYLIATAPAGATPWVRSEITVGADDVTGLTLRLRDGLSVRGRVVFADDPTATSGQPSRPQPIMLGSLVGSGHDVPEAVAPDGAGNFLIGPFAPGQYLVLNRPFAGRMLASAMLDGRDVSNVPLELIDRDLDGLVLTYTTRRAIVRGTVLAPPGRAADSIEVRMFPVEYRALIAEGMPSHLPVRQFQTGLVNRDGTFSLGVYMPPGEYLLAAMFRSSSRDLGEAFFDRVAPLATRVTVRAGEQHDVQLSPVSLASDR